MSSQSQHYYENKDELELELDSDSEDIELEDVFDMEIQIIKHLLYHETNRIVLEKIVPLFETLKNKISQYIGEPVKRFPFFDNELEEYCDPEYKIDSFKSEVVKILLEYLEFDIADLISIASDYTEKPNKRRDDYIERDEVAEEVLTILIHYSFHLEDNLEKEDYNNILRSLIRNKKYYWCANCLDHYPYDKTDVTLIREIWYNGDAQCIKALVVTLEPSFLNRL